MTENYILTVGIVIMGMLLLCGFGVFALMIYTAFNPQLLMLL